VRLVLTAILYFLAARLGLAFVLMPEGVAPVWPAGGVFLAALLLERRSRWVWITATLFAVDLTAELLAGIPPTLSLIFSLTLAGQAILSALLMQRFGSATPTLGRVREVLVLVLLNAAAANLVSALPPAIGSTLLTGSDLAPVWQWWWVSDATGILVVTPLALTAAAGWRALRAGPPRRRLEAVILLAGIVVTTSIVFASEPGHRFFSFAYLTLPLLVGGAVRFGPFGAAVATFTAGAIAFLPTLRGLGPLTAGAGGVLEDALQLQVYLAVVSITLLLIAALVTQGEDARRAAEEAERAESASLAQLDAVFAGAPVGLAFHDRDLRVVRINERLAAINGLPVEAHRGRTLSQVVPELAPMVEPLLRRVLESGEAVTDLPMTGRTRASPDSDRHWLTSFYPVRGPGGLLAGVGVVVLETTEQRRLEAQLVQSQRLEAVGRLAGGIAHDFNNLVTAILGYAALVRESAQGDVLKDVDEIEKAALRAADLTAQLLAFARKQVVEPRIIVLSALLKDMERLLRRLIGENIDLAVHVAPDLWPVKVDPTRMEQVIANLAVNARDAMPNGGRLTIELANATLDQEYSRDRPEVVPGPYVMLAVSDTGAGMSAETLARIFEPFFTTKEPGRGTGLGLATCYGIVKQAEGHIWAYSEPGRGTTLKVYLPRALGAAATETVVAPRSVEGSGKETVLVVEDELQIREMIVRVLEKRGYTVLPCGRGEEALALAGDVSRRVDLLITDVVLPGWSGREIAERVLALRPGLRMLYISGYTENSVVHHGVLEEGVDFLAKPFTPSDLVRTVRTLLDRPDA
jgi:signal transduction histidine kinase/CheY-like chemotaxis protein